MNAIPTANATKNASTNEDVITTRTAIDTTTIGVHSAACQGVARVLSRIGDKWSVLVIMMLSEKPLRFNELRRLIEGISQRMLTLTLRGLERDGLVTRHLTPIIPPRVDYQLTDLGRSLCEPVIALGAWARKHGTEIERAQQRFDRANAAAKDFVQS